jgi:hypothetical protein
MKGKHMAEKLKSLSELRAAWEREHPGKVFPTRKPVSAADVLATMTADQRRVAEDAIRSQQAAASNATSYAGKDYMTLVEEHRDKRGGTIVDAMMAVNRKHPEARADYIRRHNPHLDFSE